VVTVLCSIHKSGVCPSIVLLIKPSRDSAGTSGSPSVEIASNQEPNIMYKLKHKPSSSIVASDGFIVLLPFPRCALGMLIDFVTARGPAPPAATGLPTPNLVCSFAFLVRVTGGNECSDSTWG
jgi:hypothetical protein